MSTIGKRIKDRRIQLGMTVDELAAKIEKNRATIYRYESDEIEKMPITIISALANVLGTTPGYLMGWEDNSTPQAENIRPMPHTIEKPRLGTIACGEPIMADQNVEDHDRVPDWVECDFTLKCRGDSMIGARIYDGDIVCIRSQPQVENGEIAAVLIEDEATLKRVYIQEGRLTLMPENPAYQPLIYVGDELENVRILGKATYFISEVK